MFLLFLFLFLFSFSCSTSEKESSEVVARVGSETLTKQSLFFLVGEKANEKETLTREIKGWVESRLLYAAALSAGLDRDVSLVRQRDNFYRSLLISSFVDLQTKENIKITKKEVADYYLKNKESFKRTDEEIIVKHYTLSTKKIADKIKKELKRKKAKEDLAVLLGQQKTETKTIKKNNAGTNLVGFLFSGKVGEIVGPKKYDKGFHLFEIIQKYAVGSYFGLELVYDEIYQRLYKQKEILLLNSIVDSLYFNSDVFVSQGFLK